MTLYQPYERDKDDWYVEPRWATELLIKHERFHGTVHDPACGMGTIPEVFKAAGNETIASDISDERGYGAGGLDFLADSWWSPTDNIVSNPPYLLAEAFIDKAMLLATKKVAMFLPLQFLAGQRRNALFTKSPPTRILVFSRRPSCPPGKLLDIMKAEGGKKDYMWLIWHINPRKVLPTTIDWII